MVTAITLAAIAAGLYGASKHGISGIGKTDEEYLIKTKWEDGRFTEERIFCGWTYDNWSGEKWARWGNPHTRYGMEYDEKIYKTRKGAEKAIQELIARGEDHWNNIPCKLSIISWSDYVRLLNR